MVELSDSHDYGEQADVAIAIATAAFEVSNMESEDQWRYRGGLQKLFEWPLVEKDGSLKCPYENTELFIQHLDENCDGIFTWKAEMLRKCKNIKMDGSHKAKQHIMHSIMTDLAVAFRGPASRYNKQWMDRHLVAATSYSCRENLLVWVFVLTPPRVSPS